MNFVCSISFCACAHAQLLSCVQLFVILWTVARQAPLSIDFSRQEQMLLSNSLFNEKTHFEAHFEKIFQLLELALWERVD